jgi:undecaprenyl-phosphate 4-deoxy-4-formamido-L-arabinose transferase
MDDDMQHDPKHIIGMLKELSNNDVCYVKYKKREHNFLKILVSKLNNLVSSFLMSKSYKIYTSSFKCFKKVIKNKIISNEENFIFLDYWIFQYTNKITFIEVSHNKRYQGNTNYGFKELLTLWSKMIFLIDLKKTNYKFYLIFILRFIFLIFLKKYINYKKEAKIEILEIV